jgi:hypothetical protein
MNSNEQFIQAISQGNSKNVIAFLQQGADVHFDHDAALLIAVEHGALAKL